MSACGDFAEHVWKPGSCKNCFHPLSAHHHNNQHHQRRQRSTVRGTPDGGGVLPAVCLIRTGPGGGDEDQPGVTSPSSYSKPTIAVKPTMMMNSGSNANEAVADVNMNAVDGQEHQKSTVECLDLKKLLDLSPLYIDGCANGLRNALLQSAGTKTDYANYYGPLPPVPGSPVGQSAEPKYSNTSSIFVFQEAGRTLKDNGNGEAAFRQLSGSSAATGTRTTTTTTTTTKSTSNRTGGPGLGKAAHREPCGPSAGIPLSMEILQNHRVHTVSPVALTAEPSSTSPAPPPSAALTSFTHNASPSSPSPPSVSEPASTSDSSCSYYSSTDSLPGPERTPVGRVASPEHPQSPLTPTSSQSSPVSPDGQTHTEPIYAESTKKKRQNQSNGIHSPTNGKLKHQGQRSAQLESSSGEAQWATISVAAHTEENNRTFFLTSPDSAVSTQCHFSPTALKEPAGGPAFCWPSPGHGSPSLSPGSPGDPCNRGSPLSYPKPQSSPPIPPKRNVRSPKLGASSLSPSFCSPAPLPDLPALSLLSPKRESPLKPGPEGGHGAGPAERRHKPHNHHSTGVWSCRIVEEEEEEEGGERKDRDAGRSAGKSGSTSRPVGTANGAAVWRETRDWRSRGNLPPQPPHSPNNGVSQGQTEATTAAGEEARHTGSMLAKASLLAASTERLLLAGRKPGGGHESSTASPPPPPPPKKHHR
ncbi:hypothetical protein NHX12_027521 [Muraenolepis orangiensis]|uniref:Uncharacterized protein n=1 Tax=Muraenolepis orangiensis TaxID=630683 RepID=A0A9Q0EDW6_9TELE|nr:hypothetical protein NHX12_027521 [Muraenolepis orangiensis]